MTLSALAIIVNAVLLLIALVLAIIIMRAGSLHTYHYGDSAYQERMRWIILKALVALIAIGVAASIFNIVHFL